ncbi:solute carrier family 22 member 7-like [Dermacentor andersoni]|uniref:solute carrier family 22 member 7-like n=1 Tax=Dermacentor andersoni TaxID=34620 RepID=UPI003B3AF2B7
MAASAPAAQATSGETPQPRSSLLTGFSTADTHKAIQDNVYVILGHGAVQRRILCTGILSAVVLLMHALGSRLFTHDVHHWCAPPHELRDVPVDVWRNVAIPLGPDGKPSQCDVYDPPIAHDGEERHLVPCQQWDYDTVSKGDSIISRWDLVCSHVWLFKVIMVAYMLGAALCVPMAGLLADRVGRRPAIMGCVLALLCFSIGCAVSQTLIMYVVTRFFVAASSCSAQVLIFILLYEMTGNERRALYGILDTAVGVTTVSPVLRLTSLLKPHWDLAHAFLVVPTAMLVFWCYLLEESPCWLLVTGRARSAEHVVMLAAKTNGVDPHKARLTFKALREQLKKLESASTASSATDTFAMTTTFRRRAFAVVLCWFSVNFTYYGLIERDVATEDLWLAVGTFLQAALYAIVWRHLYSHGQRETFFIALGLLGILMVFQVAVHFAGVTALFALANTVVVSMSAVTLSVNYCYTADVFPTVVRSLGLALSYAVGRLGVLAAGFLEELAYIRSETSVNLLMTVLVLLSAAALQWLPEIFVEKRQADPSQASLNPDQRKKNMQKSLTPVDTTLKQSCAGKRSRKARKIKSPSRSNASPPPEPKDKAADQDMALKP